MGQPLLRLKWVIKIAPEEQARVILAEEPKFVKYKSGNINTMCHIAFLGNFR